MEGGLKDLVDEKAAIIDGWIAEGKIAKVDPVHLIFSIWALTQHYADFEVQIRAILGKKDPFKGAEIFLDMVFRKLLDPNT
jgi:TetR/AcrR family transcriptional regulator